MNITDISNYFEVCVGFEIYCLLARFVSGGINITRNANLANTD